MITFVKKFFSKSNSFLSKLLGVAGVLCIILGIIFICLSFSNEVLDDKYIVSDIKEMNYDKKNIKSGEVKLLKKTKYIKKGTFKITYIIEGNGSNLLKDKTIFNITDIQSSGYSMNEKITINGKEYQLDGNSITTKEKIKLSYTSNILNIDIPSNYVFDTTITMYLTLHDREVNYEYRTSLDTYYNFTPSDKNNFYEKKEPQSYFLNDESYILLKNK
mgnify:CR=1 FL=1